MKSTIAVLIASISNIATVLRELIEELDPPIGK
jgi:hypothetical protein